MEKIVSVSREFVSAVTALPKLKRGLRGSFGNAYPVGRQRRGDPQDHRHRLRTIRAYDYRDAATLLGDFWTTVDAVLRDRGVVP